VERGLTQEQVATRVGRSRAAVANRLRLLGLPPAARDLLVAGSLTEGHARALLGCADPAMLDMLARRVVERDLSVRETEELVRRLSVPSPELGPHPNFGGGAKDPELGTRDSLEEDLQRTLGTKVQITRSRRGGR